MKLRFKLLIAAVLQCILCAGVLLYLNNVFLPVKIKSSIVISLENITGKKVFLQSVRLNVFKGLVLENLKIYDDNRTIAGFKEASCNFLIWPFFKKQVIITSVTFKSPEIFLERRQDNTLNVADFFRPVVFNAPVPFSVTVNKVIVIDGAVEFKDSTLTPAFLKKCSRLNAVVALSLPASAKIGMQCEFASGSSGIKGTPASFLRLDGGYNFLNQQFAGQGSLKGGSLKDFEPYFRAAGISSLEGSAEAVFSLTYKDNVCAAEGKSVLENIILTKDDLTARFNAQVPFHVSYNTKTGFFNYVSNAVIKDGSLAGIRETGPIERLNGIIQFSPNGFSSADLGARVKGIPLKLRFHLADFSHPDLTLDGDGPLDLAEAQKIAKELFKVDLPVTLSGESKLAFSFKTKIPAAEALKVRGSLKISKGTVTSGKLPYPVLINGARIDFLPDRFTLSGASLTYNQIPYEIKAVMTDFSRPNFVLDLESKDLTLGASFVLRKQSVSVDKCKGRYLNSTFIFNGDIDCSDFAKPWADIKGKFSLSTDDAGIILKQYAETFKKVGLRGLIQGKVSFSGTVTDTALSALEVHLTSDEIRAYGLRFKDCIVDYSQENGLGEMTFAQTFLYDGSIQATAKINRASRNPPFTVNVIMDGVRIEKLKVDTGAKAKDIAGSLRGDVKLNGLLNEPGNLTGAGQLFIKDGKLWELNLFKGLGSLLFTEDFTRIVFNEGYCAFSVQDKYVFTDSIRMRSSLSDLTGEAKIGFNGTIEGALNVHVSEEAPLTGGFRDVTTAILGQAGRFGIIKISNTLSDPKFLFQVDYGDILKSFKNALFNNKR